MDRVPPVRFAILQPNLSLRLLSFAGAEFAEVRDVSKGGHAKGEGFGGEGRRGDGVFGEKGRELCVEVVN